MPPNRSVTTKACLRLFRWPGKQNSIRFGIAGTERIWETGEVVYEGSSLVTVMVPYKGGVLTAFRQSGWAV